MRDGRIARWGRPRQAERHPPAKPGNATTVILRDAQFNRPVEGEAFSQRNLQKK
jgi:hypothetical protein